MCMYISSIPNRIAPASSSAILPRKRQSENRTLANLSHWNPARIEALRRALRGDFDHVEPCEAALGPIFGILYVLKQIADALGIPACSATRAWPSWFIFDPGPRSASGLSFVGGALGPGSRRQRSSRSRFVRRRRSLRGAGRSLCPPEKIEQALFRLYLRRKAAPPRLFLYDVTSSYLEGEQNELGNSATTAMVKRANCKSSLACSPMRRANRWRCACLRATPRIQ